MKRFHFPTLDSTNVRASRLARLHPGEALLISARTQTHGRGRSGRTWSSPAGGAWFTLVWPTRPDRTPQHYAPAPLLAGLALVQTLEQVIASGAGHALQLKWPNDVLLDGQKVAGILCERSLPGQPDGDAKAPAPLLVGVGVNANFDPLLLGNDLRFPATTLLHALGHPVDLSGLIHGAADRIAQRLATMEAGGLAAPLVDAMASRLAWHGQRVTLQQGRGPVTGVCRGLSPAGELLLEAEGQLQAFSFGEVSQLRLAERAAAAPTH